MYCDFYELQVDPFRLSPDHRFCLHHPSFVRAKAYMRFALEQQEGFVVVTGKPGTGKTTLIDELVAESDPGRYRFARLMSVQMDANDLLHMVGFAFSVPIEGLPKASLLRTLTDYFRQQLQEGRRSVLIVDEAQGLSREALEELRLLTNFAEADRPLLQIFLVGQEELRERIIDPSLDQLNQRIVAACHMEPLKPRESVAYVLHRLRIAGWKHSPRLESEIFPALFRFSGGIPRRINRIFGRLLLHGFLEQKQQLTVADIDLVVAELRAEHLSNLETSAIIDLTDFDAADLQALAESAVLEDVPVTADQQMGERLLRQRNSCEEVVVEPLEPSSPLPASADHQAAGAEIEVTERPVQHEAIDLLEQATLARRHAQRVDYSPLWGLAATLVVALGVSALSWLGATPGERQRLTPQSLLPWVESYTTPVAIQATGAAPASGISAVQRLPMERAVSPQPSRSASARVS